MIPPSDPRASYLSHREAIDAAIRRVLASGRFITGDELLAFEREFAAYLGASHGAGVASGTDAIELALRACGVQAGDLVFTVSHTAVGTVVAVERIGAIPILVDVGAASYTMDPASLEEAIRAARASLPGRPKAVVPVHLYGQAAEIEAIREVARTNDLVVVEDCAQAHGAALGGRKLGTFGHAAAFSFYPTKNLAGLGDGGMVVTSDPDVADRVRALREYGWKERFVSAIPGVNSRLDEIQAAVLRAKLPHLDEENERRRSLALRYSATLPAGDVTGPSTRPGCAHAFHQYVVRCGTRDELRAFLSSRGVGTAIHYPVPVHLQPAYQDRLPRLVPLTESERAAREVLSLPIHPELTDQEQSEVIAQIQAWPGRFAEPRSRTNPVHGVRQAAGSP